MQKTVELELSGVTLQISGDFQPREPEWFDPIAGVGDPGCQAEFTVNSVWLGAYDLTHLLSDLYLRGVAHPASGPTYEYYDTIINLLADMARDKVLSEQNL